jgi:hypothetical protein
MYHYTYLLLGYDGRFYYGVRSCKCRPSEDKYMGSFKDRTFSPKKKRILGLFSSRQEALQEEIRIHALKNVDKSKKYANRAKQKTDRFNFSASGKDNPNYGGGNVSAEGRKRISETMRLRGLDRTKNPFAKRGEESQSFGRRWFSSPDLSQEIYLKKGENPPSGWIPGRIKRPPRSEESRERTRKALKGKPKSEQHKQKLSESVKKYFDQKRSQDASGVW